MWNAARHSGADAVKVTVRSSPHSVELIVADEGRGFDISQASHADSLGLVSMRERARLIRADLNVDSSLGSGTTVRVVAWLEAAE